MKNSIYTVLAAAGLAVAQQGAYQQCGGKGYTGSAACVSGYTCHVYNDYYSQCIPAAQNQAPAPTTTTRAPSPHTTTTPKAQTTTKPTTKATSKPTTTAPAASPSPPSSGGSGKVQYAGINIAGFDFGCGTDGTCNLQSTTPPATGNAQMKHFVTDDGLNAFRLPVAWQYLVNNKLGGTLDSANFATYDGLVQGCLNAGAALCIIDIHNYARWNGQVVGQSGGAVQDKDLASLWSQLATKYKSNSKIAFGVINEPHDVDITTWASTVQAVVTAIRAAGATNQKILLPGTDYTSAGAFISNGSGAALQKVKNPDGSTTNLIFDVHKYLDVDNSGTHAECTTNNVDVFTALGTWLRQNKRQAILTETGGGQDTQSCLTDVCQELATLNSYSDVFLGWLGWGAGAFDPSYVLSETPVLNGNTWTDQPLVSKCIVGQFK